MANLSIIRCTGLLRNKNYCISTSKIPSLTQNLLQNQIDLFLASIRNMKWLGNIKKKECWENVDIRLSRSKGEDG